MMKNTLVSIAIPLKSEDSEYYIWMQTRQEEGPLNGKLEFAGGKIEQGEDALQAIVREFAEEVGPKVHANNLKLLNNYPYEYPDRKVILHAYLLNFTDLDQRNWFKLPLGGDIKKLQKMTLEANAQILTDLAAYLLYLRENQCEEYLWM
jgi:8-oxo-dGTP diphosphatase